VIGQVLRDDASLDVGGAAGRIVDDHGDGLALVELGKRNLRDDGGNQCGETGDEQKSSRHSATSQTLPLRARRPAAMTGAARERTLRRYWKHGRLSSARGGGGDGVT
jgi:hypothetical protein